MRPWSMGAAAALQVLVLAVMAGEREWILRTGKPVFLRTVPVDPRDVFRGDYVRLDYEISTLEPEALRDRLREPASPARRRDSKVYAVLEVGEGGLGELQHATDEQPTSGLFIRGRLEHEHWGSFNSLRVRYGLEALFVQEGRGLELEQERSRSGIQLPFEVEAAVSAGGVAVLRGWRWSPIGIGLEIERQPARPGGAAPTQRSEAPAGPPPPFRVKARLLNAGEKPLAVIDLPGHGSFQLRPVRGTGSRWSPVETELTPPAPTAAAVHLLEPGAVYETTLDFSEPRWALRSPSGEVRTLGELTWSEWFRLVYAPPAAAACSHLEEAASIWHGKLPSRSLNGGRSVD